MDSNLQRHEEAVEGAFARHEFSCILFGHVVQTEFWLASNGHTLFWLHLDCQNAKQKDGKFYMKFMAKSHPEL